MAGNAELQPDDPTLAAGGVGGLPAVHSATAPDVPVDLALELRRKHEQLELALTAAHAISWNTDVTTWSSTYSSDFRQFFGLPPGDYSGQRSLAVVHDDERESVKRAALESLTNGRDFRLEFRGIDVRGEPRWYTSHGTTIRDAHGKPSCMVGIVWDSTARHVMQEERAALERRLRESQKLESLGVLAGGVAHDFNNLLTTIIANTSLVRQLRPAGEPELSYLEQVEEAARRAADLCQQMLAYAGKGRFVLEPSDLNRLIEDTRHLLSSTISKKAELRLELASSLPAVVIDPAQIRQVLMNLVINASDAMGTRSGTITIRTGVTRVEEGARNATASCGTEHAAGDYAFLEVSDNGVGMTQELKARIFEPFFSTKFAGRGLGLATVLGIARGHHGGIEVQSEPEHGASFKLLLPIAAEQKLEHDASRVQAAAAGTTGQGTILVVDDEPGVRKVTCEALAMMGFRVLAAENGRRAIARYREHQSEIVCVLMDLTMPEIDGEEAFAELRRINPEVRVLLMSGYNEQDAVAGFFGKGLAGFLHKPFDFDTLDRQVRALLA